MKLYQERLMDHFHHPRNRGTIPNPDFATEEYNPSCGDSISMQGIVKDGILVDVAFTGKGCVISQAAASLLTDAVKGKPIQELLTLDAEYLQQLLGIPLGPLRLKCGLLSLVVLQEGLAHMKIE